MKITVYGDSILKGVLLEDGKYRINREWEERLRREHGLEIRNKAHFGSTIGKALGLIRRDAEKTYEEGELAVLEFGGNDCDYDWAAVSADPDGTHTSKTPPEEFLPLYRQAQIYARQGTALDRSTLADWVGHAAFHLRPLHERLLTLLRARSKLFADETTVPVLDPGRGRTKTGQLWAYAADDWPWGGLDPPGIAYVYAPDRKAERLFSHLAGFKGILQVDGYIAYPKLADRGEVELAFCWVHMRRNFYELATAGPAPIASEALKHIAAFYAIEKEIRGRSAEERRLVRQQTSRPLADAFEAWLRGKLALISQKIKLADAIRYALSRWQSLTRFIDDGRIELDNNTVERSIRGIKLSRKNALFAGCDGGAEHWAVVASLVETCKINDVDPLAYLTDVLTRIVNGHPNRDIDQLLPWAYRAQALKAVA